ncbi:Fic family protein [Dyadobacter endophyticus]|uniref:Fic family protein n=1 Tax=Dyadobacter endophyticus TaxID=1749036 RepID=UPI00166863FC|nr:Fic family protein [Dyadobacter endophyticus]
MADRNYFSGLISIFHGTSLPEPGFLAGYSALMKAFNLKAPRPESLAMISAKHKIANRDGWLIFSPRHQPDQTLIGHLIFALKYEGVDLYLIKQVFLAAGKSEVTNLVKRTPNGKYVRRIWLLYEWLFNERLEIPDLAQGNYVKLIDERLQYASKSPTKSSRHRITNNLPGVPEFCPLIRRTEILDKYIDSRLSEKLKKIINGVNPIVIARAASHLQLKEANASYAIEGERPLHRQAILWGLTIGKSGPSKITQEELVRLAQIVLGGGKTPVAGYRRQQGFIGEHDYLSGMPIPDHISARWEDLEGLMDGLIKTAESLETDNQFDTVLAAAIVAFGFVFIHPFADGNGRLHRYLIQYLLHRKGFIPKGQVIPVSAIILNQILNYRRVLESFSLPRLPLIEWKPAPDNNVQINNETGDLYRYFDATQQAEFLYSCVLETIEVTIPEQINYLQKYDRMKAFLDDFVPLADNMVSRLVHFLNEGKGHISKWVKDHELKEFTESEVLEIEAKYQQIFGSDQLPIASGY